jgi:hypothetical protein
LKKAIKYGTLHFQIGSLKLKRDGVCNPITHVLKAIEVFKRFGRGCKPRPASDHINKKATNYSEFVKPMNG